MQDIDMLLFKKEMEIFVHDNFMVEIGRKYLTWDDLFKNRNSIDIDFNRNHYHFNMNFSGNKNAPLTLSVLRKKTRFSNENIMEFVLHTYHLSDRPDFKKFKTTHNHHRRYYNYLEKENGLNMIRHYWGVENLITIEDFKDEWSDGDEIKEEVIKTLNGLKLMYQEAFRRERTLMPVENAKNNFYWYFPFRTINNNDEEIIYLIIFRYIGDTFNFTVKYTNSESINSVNKYLIKECSFKELYDAMNHNLDFDENDENGNLSAALQMASVELLL